MKPILFLDIDGVLHPDNAAEIVVEGGEWHVTGEGLFRWAPLVMDLIAPFDTQIVIHSSWRNHYRLHELKAFFPEAFRHRIMDVTGRGGRYQSIVEYVRERGVEHFRVLDDARSEFPDAWMHLVPCDGALGISNPLVQESVVGFLGATTKPTRVSNPKRRAL